MEIRGGPAAVTSPFLKREKEPFQLERITVPLQRDGKIVERAGESEDDRQAEQKGLMAKGPFLH